MNLHRAHKITPRLANFLKNLREFAPKRENDLGQKFRQTRVAIIDNGILSITPISNDKAREIKEGKNKDKAENRASITTPAAKVESSSPNGQDTNTAGLEANQEDENPRRDRSLRSRIKGGQSFMYDGSKAYPWLFASDSHGTQMANLICAMDPFCDLYVARVAEGKYGITPDRAAEVSVRHV